MESTVLAALRKPPLVCLGLDGDTRTKPGGGKALQAGEALAARYGGKPFVLQKDSIEAYLLTPEILARVFRQDAKTIGSKSEERAAKWKELRDAKRVRALQEKWVFENLIEHFLQENPRPIHCAQVASAMSGDEIPAEVRGMIEEMRALLRSR